MQKFYEFADIGNIMKKLHDIDKLKWALLQINESKFYDLFPRSDSVSRASRVKMKETDRISEYFRECIVFFLCVKIFSYDKLGDEFIKEKGIMLTSKKKIDFTNNPKRTLFE